MRKLVTLMLVLVVSVSMVATGALAQAPETQSRLTLAPIAAYRIFVPPDATEGFVAVWAGAAELGYLIPVTIDGQHNIGVAGGLGVGTDVAGTGFRIGYAYAPREIRNIIFGVNGIFDLMFPSDNLIDDVLGGPTGSNTWVSAGLEGALDFPIPGLGNGSLSAYYAWGIREAPDQFGFALAIPMQPVSPEARVKRFNE